MSEQGIASPMAAGWYADPSMPGNGRWRDGSGWTNHVYVVPPAPLTPIQQHAADQRARGQGPGLTVAGVLMSLLGLMFVGIPGTTFLGSPSAAAAIGAFAFMIVGAGLLTTGVLMVVAPDKIGARQL